MKKIKFIILCMILLIFVFVLSACTGVPNSKKEIFKKYQIYFDNIKSFMLLEQADKSDYQTYSIIYDDSHKIVDLYGITQPLTEKELTDLNIIINAFNHDFSFIGVSSERVSFGGNGNDMFVYSVNGKSPKWFYSPFSKMKFSKEKLSENWFYLYNHVR